MYNIVHVRKYRGTSYISCLFFRPLLLLRVVQWLGRDVRGSHSGWRPNSQLRSLHIRTRFSHNFRYGRLPRRRVRQRCCDVIRRSAKHGYLPQQPLTHGIHRVSHCRTGHSVNTLLLLGLTRDYIHIFNFLHFKNVFLAI